MSESTRGTERLSRALVHLLPRSLRQEFGDDMVQLARDRRRHRGEPLWRLWPSLVSDASSAAVRFRWEEAMFPVRAVLIGFGIAIAIIGAISGDPFIALGVVAVVVVVARLTRSEHPVAVAPSAGRWKPWVVAGVVFLAIAVAVMAMFGDEEMSAVQWSAFMGSLLLGFVGLATGAVLAASGRAPRDTTSGLPHPPAV